MQAMTDESVVSFVEQSYERAGYSMRDGMLRADLFDERRGKCEPTQLSGVMICVGGRVGFALSLLAGCCEVVGLGLAVFVWECRLPTSSSYCH